MNDEIFTSIFILKTLSAYVGQGKFLKYEILVQYQGLNDIEAKRSQEMYVWLIWMCLLVNFSSALWLFHF